MAKNTVVDDLLKEAGFIKNKTYKEVRFLKVPDTTFAVWTDAKSARGSDLDMMIVNHSIRVELYSFVADEESSTALEKALNIRGLEWDCGARLWLPDEQMFMLIYTFSYDEKI